MPANENRPKSAAGQCPICGKPTDEDHRPFCSKRCADVDLSRWLSAAYAIPAEETDDEEQSYTAPDKGDEGF